MLYPGRLFIISAPSGAGKTSLVKRITKEISNLAISISYTTRSKRPTEEHAIDYFFVSEHKFLTLQQQGAFLESHTVFGNYYGTSKELVYNLLAAGKDLVLEIDWQGAKQVKQALATQTLEPQEKPIEITSIFIIPPSLQILADRLTARGTDDPDTIKNRLHAAQTEISHYTEYDYLIINDQFEQAAKNLKLIIQAQSLNTKIQSVLHQNLINDLLG